MAQPEHNLQVQVHKFTRDCIAAPHVFLAFDRSRRQSATQHIREKARGLRAGTADTLTLVLGGAPVWVELKVGTNKPTEVQLQFAADVEAVGCRWCWANSVERFRQCLVAAGVPLSPGAEVEAARLGALLARPKVGKGPRRSGKPRTTTPTAAGLKFGRTHSRLGGLFG